MTDFVHTYTHTRLSLYAQNMYGNRGRVAFGNRAALLRFGQFPEIRFVRSLAPGITQITNREYTLCLPVNVCFSNDCGS